MELLLDEIDTAIGTILLIADRQALCALEYADQQTQLVKRLTRRYGQLQLATSQKPTWLHRLTRSLFCRESQCA